MKRPTFAAARQAMLDGLSMRGWSVTTQKTSGGKPLAMCLRVPYATSPSGRVRLWFKPQAVWCSWGMHHEMGDARSLHVDLRDCGIEEILDRAKKWDPRYAELDDAFRKL